MYKLTAKLKNRIILFLLSFLLLLSGCAQIENNNLESQAPSAIQIIDDSGNLIKMQKPAQRIISLYSAHTENLYSLGLDEEIIGVGTHDSYPPQIRGKAVFDYKSDPEKVIAANPDLVLIRPRIERTAPDFVESLKKAHINVVSFYPDSFEKFDSYIENLGKVVGREERAAFCLLAFHQELDDVQKTSQGIDHRVKVFFESTETKLRTITPDSMPAHAIALAGGTNIASDAVAIRKGTSIAEYGAESLLEKASDIDIYIAQKGTMNAGGSVHSISIRPGFKAIKAVKEGHIYTIDEKFVSSPTFRFATGVHELARIFYPELFDKLDIFQNVQTIDREELAKAAVMFKHKAIFSPSSRYYKKEHRGHVYGAFKDMKPEDPAFNYVETAVLSAYMEGDGDFFRPKQKISRDELAEVLFMFTDLPDLENDIEIADLKDCQHQRAVELLVANGILPLKDGKFLPAAEVSGQEMLDAMNKLKQHEESCLIN